MIFLLVPALACAVWLAAPASAGFMDPYELEVGEYPIGVDVGDVTADGVPDLVTADLFGDTVSVLEGNGDGSFASAVQYPVGGRPRGIVAEDLTSDGLGDIAVALQRDDQVWVLEGAPDGGFGDIQKLSVGDRPAGLTATDFNRDGRRDLAVTNLTDDEVSVLLARADGGFRPQRVSPALNLPIALAAGKLDRAPGRDLAVANFKRDGVSVLSGRRNGYFKYIRSYRSPRASTTDIAIGHIDEDAKADLVFLATGGEVTVRRGRGDGTFEPRQRWRVGGSPWSLVVLDLTGDGEDDVAVAVNGYYNPFPGYVALLRGHRHGAGFAEPKRYPVTRPALGISAGDLNGDLMPDVAASVRSESEGQPGLVAILLNE